MEAQDIIETQLRIDSQDGVGCEGFPKDVPDTEGGVGERRCPRFKIKKWASAAQSDLTHEEVPIKRKNSQRTPKNKLSFAPKIKPKDNDVTVSPMTLKAKFYNKNRKDSSLNKFYKNCNDCLSCPEDNNDDITEKVIQKRFSLIKELRKNMAIIKEDIENNRTPKEFEEGFLSVNSLLSVDSSSRKNVSVFRKHISKAEEMNLIFGEGESMLSTPKKSSSSFSLLGILKSAANEKNCRKMLVKSVNIEF